MITQEKVTILFAGDSGDGMQLTGTQFTENAALFGNDVSTFPNFPAEIRAPQGTLPGVSGFQIQFGSVEIDTAGDMVDVLVVMNAAALKANVNKLKKGGTILANRDGFDAKNLRLAGYTEDKNPIEETTLQENYKLHSIAASKIIKLAVADKKLSTKDIDKTKNMFFLGFIYWIYGRTLDTTVKFITQKFQKNPVIAESNILVLQAGYNYGETTESSISKVEVVPAKQKPGTYRNIIGNTATAIGLVAAAQQAGLPLFYGTYPITPASDILHELSKHKNFGVQTFQAEDEIAAIGAAIGASFGGFLGVTASSGPGIALKTEAMGLAIMLELPLVIINVQRGGPSTGLPTKTEQADLLQAVYGRNGEAPMLVVAPQSPSDCFTMVVEACKLSIENMTPVLFLSDGYLANGSEPWKFPTSKDLPTIKADFATMEDKKEGVFLPYLRNESLVRKWAIPGTKGLEHRIGGLEKEKDTGNISYDPDNHEYMVKIRAEKVQKVASKIPLQAIEQQVDNATILVLGWGSTYGSIKTAVRELIKEGVPVAQAHIRYIQPFPSNLKEILAGYTTILIPEMNNGQLVKIINAELGVQAHSITKIKGMPFGVQELKQEISKFHNL